MEGTAMNYHCLDPHNQTFPVSTDGAAVLSLTRPCAQVPDSEPTSILNTRLLAAKPMQKGRHIANLFDFVLDFNRNFPHSTVQTDIQGD